MDMDKGDWRIVWARIVDEIEAERAIRAPDLASVLREHFPHVDGGDIDELRNLIVWCSEAGREPDSKGYRKERRQIIDASTKFKHALAQAHPSTLAIMEADTSSEGLPMLRRSLESVFQLAGASASVWAVFPEPLKRKHRERSPDARAIADELHAQFARWNGHARSVTRPVEDDLDTPPGPYADLVEDVFRALGLKASAINQATEAAGRKRVSRSLKRPAKSAYEAR